MKRQTCAWQVGDETVVFMHDGPEVISSAFVSPLLAVFQGNDFQFQDCAVEKSV